MLARLLVPVEDERLAGAFPRAIIKANGGEVSEDATRRDGCLGRLHAFIFELPKGFLGIAAASVLPNERLAGAGLQSALEGREHKLLGFRKDLALVGGGVGNEARIKNVTHVLGSSLDQSRTSPILKILIALHDGEQGRIPFDALLPIVHRITGERAAVGRWGAFMGNTEEGGLSPKSAETIGREG